MLGDRGIYFGSGVDTSGFSADVKKMRDDILSITKAGEKVDLSAIGDQISAQRDYIQKLEKDYARLNKTLETMAPGKARAELIAEHKKIGTAIESEKQALENLNTVYKSFANEQKSVRSQQRAVRHELYALAEAGKENTAEFHELLKTLAGFDSSVDSVKAIQNALRRGNIEMQAFTGTIRAGTGIFATMTGFMGMFTDQNERLMEIQTRLQSVLAISMGIEQAHQALLKESSLVQSVRLIQLRAATKARQAEAKGTLASAAAQRVYNAVAKANPYVLIAGAIISVVGALALLSRRTREAGADYAEFQKKANDSIAGTMTQYQLLRNEWNRLGDDLKARERFIKENAGQFDSLGISIEGVADAERAFVTRTGSMIQAIESRAKAQAAQELAQDAYKEYLEQLDKQIEVNQKLADRNLWQGIKTGWSRLAGIDEPIDKANQALERFKILIGTAAAESESAASSIKSMDLEKAFEPKKDKKVPKSFEEMLNLRLRLWEDYYKSVDAIGREAAGKVYSGTIDVDSSFVEELRKQKKELEDVGELTLKQAANLNTINDMIARLTREKSPFEKQKEEIDKSLAGFDTLTEKIKFLKEQQKGLGDSFQDLELSAHLKAETDKLIDDRQRMYDDFVKAHQTYLEKVDAINKRRTDLLAVTDNPEDIARINEQAAKEKYDAYIDMVKSKHKDISKVFTDINALTREQLITFRDIFQAELERATDNAQKIELGKIVSNINEQLHKIDNFPLKELIKDFEQLKKSTDDSFDPVVLRRFGNNLQLISRQFGDTVSSIRSAAGALGIEMNSIFGDIISNAEKAVSAANDIGAGIETIGKAAESGDPIGKIQGIAQIAEGVAKAISISFSGSRERQIQRITNKIEELDRAYQDLQSRFSQGLYLDAGDFRDMIDNINQRIALLQQNIEKETKSWGVPNIQAIQSWLDEIENLQGELERITGQIAEGILGISVESMADKLSDSIVGAFERGEDAAEALNKTVGDVFRNMVRNMIASGMEPKIKAIFDDVTRMMGYDPATGEQVDFRMLETLRPEEMKEIRERLKAVAQEFQSTIDWYGDLFNDITDETGKPDGLRGAIRGMTQETADILAGQFNAIRMDTSSILLILERGQDRADMAILHLSNIDDNTGKMLTEIRILNDKLDNSDTRSAGVDIK